MRSPSGEPTVDESKTPLSRAEAGEFARQLAGITEAGLPLGSGLLALADELPKGRLRVTLRDLASRLDAGESLESALDAIGPRFPSSLRGLVAAGVRSGRLGESLGRYLELEDLRNSLRSRLRVGLAYPIMMLVTSFGLFMFVSMVTTRGFEEIFKDFGIQIPRITQVLVTASHAFGEVGWWALVGPAVGVGVIWGVTRLTLGAVERRRLIHRLPLIGPLVRDSALAQFCPVLALMVESEVPLAEALKLAAESSPDPAMAEAAREMAEDVGRGMSLAEATRDRRPVPAGFDLFLDWAERNRGLVDALRLLSEAFETRARARAAFIARFCNVVTMTVVLWWVSLSVLALFIPLLMLLNGLNGGGPALPNDWPDGVKVAMIGAIAILSVAAVLAIVWPLVRRSPAAPIDDRSPSPQRNRFWYLAGMGWTLIGLVTVMFAGIWGMRKLASDWLPEWWDGEIGPMFEILGVALAGAGLLMVIFSAVAARWSRRRTTSAEKAPQGGTIERVRIRPRGFRFGLRHLMFSMAPIALLLVLMREFGWSILAILALLVPPLVVVISFLALTDRRGLQRDSLLHVMAMAAREGQPLAPAIAAFAPTCRGRYAGRVAELAARLERGESLPRALTFVPGVLSRTGETVARVGWETGTLSRMLDDAVAAAEAAKAARVVAVGSIAYPFGVLAVILGITGFLGLHVAPQFVRIFADFQVDLPEPSRSVFAACGRWLTPFGRLDLYISAVVGIGIGIFVAIAAWIAIFVGRRVMDWIPLFDRIERRRHTAIIFRTLAAAVDAGQTLPTTLARLGASYPREWIRRRLRWSAERVERGEVWSKALRESALMTRSDAVLLGAAERVGNLPWALRETAASGERRMIYRLMALGQVSRLVVMVAMGGLVFLFAITYFRPLISLIDIMSERI